jgi:hypothetical protein
MVVEPVSHLPDALHCFHLLFCLFGVHALFLISKLWASAMVLAPFVIYRRRNPSGLTLGQVKKCQNWGMREGGVLGVVFGNEESGFEEKKVTWEVEQVISKASFIGH